MRHVYVVGTSICDQDVTESIAVPVSDVEELALLFGIEKLIGLGLKWWVLDIYARYSLSTAPTLDEQTYSNKSIVPFDPTHKYRCKVSKQLCIREIVLVVSPTKHVAISHTTTSRLLTACSVASLRCSLLHQPNES
jgi:hypothetical protein